MKENPLIFENIQSGNNTQRKNESENKMDNQTDIDYLQIFCKDISKINNRDECGWTPLYRSVVSGILLATELLLNNGADPNIQSSMGETPLYQAVDMERISHVNLLLQKNANPNISQVDGLSPLHLAVNKQNILIIKELLKYKADPNNKTSLYEQTPLHFAIKNNVDPMILLILIQYNGSLFIKDKFGKRPLDYVKSEEMKKVIEKLKLENGEKALSKIINNHNTSDKENKFSESKKLSDSSDTKIFIKEKKINFEGNVILQQPGDIFHHYFRASSGANGIDTSNKIRKHLFQNKYNKKIIKKSNYNDNKDINEKYSLINNNHNKINKGFFNKIKKNIIKNNSSSKKENIDLNIDIDNKKFPYKDSLSLKKKQEKYSTMQYNDEKILKNKKLFNKKNKNINIPILPINKNIKNPYLLKDKNNFILTDKEKESSTGLNSLNSSNSKNESNLKNRLVDFNNISEIQKFTLIPKESRNKKVFSHCLLNKKLYSETTKSSMDHNSISSSETNDLVSKKFNSIQINEYKSKNRLYRKPKITINESSSLEKINNQCTLSIINNKSFNNKNFLNNNMNKLISSSTKNINLLDTNNKNKVSLNLKKFKLQKKVLKNCAIPFDKKKIPYNKRGTYNCNSNIYNAINSLNNNDSFLDNLSQMYMHKNDNNFSSIYESIIIDLEKYPIYDWLNEINLSCYSHLFIQNKIYDLKNVILDMKKGKISMYPKDIFNLGIKIHGHIYRIFVKLEIDSGLIDKKIVEIIENKKYGEKNEEINILNNSIYNLCGCCSLKERSKSNIKNYKDNIYEIEQWLININMLKYKKNFIENGFDKFEYFFLQMFGRFPIDSSILKNSIGINNEKDRDLILLQLQKDVKYISSKSKKERNLSNPNILRIHEKSKTIEEKDSSQECQIF